MSSPSVGMRPCSEELGVDKELLTSEYSFLQEKYEAALDFKTKRDCAYPETADYPVFKTVHDNLAMWCAYDEIVNYVSTNVGGVEYFAGQGAGEKVFNVFDTPEFVQICKDIRKFVDARLIPQYQENFDEDNALLNTGIIPLRTSQGIVSIKPDIDGDWVAEMNRSKVAISSTGYLQSAITAVSTSSKNPERAVMYMNLQYSDEYIATASRFGIEGVHYNIVQDDNGNDRLDFTGTPNGAEALSDRTYYNWYGAQWGNLFKCILPINQPDDVFEKLQKMNEDAGQYETNLGFVFNQESVVNEIAACAGVIDEFRKPLMAGAYPEDQIEAKCAEFVEKLKANGIQKIVDEAQSQLNEWRAAQGKTTYKG